MCVLLLLCVLCASVVRVGVWFVFAVTVCLGALRIAKI